MAADRLGKTRELLLQAVESLRDSTSSPPPPALERNSAPPNSSQASGCSERASVIGERNRLFNFGFLKNVGTGGGKRVSCFFPKPPLMSSPASKKVGGFLCVVLARQTKL